MAITSAEQLRDAAIDNINRMLDTFRVSVFLTSEEKKQLKAQREYWRVADQAAIQSLYEKFRMAESEESAP